MLFTLVFPKLVNLNMSAIITAALDVRQRGCALESEILVAVGVGRRQIVQHASYS